VEYWCPSASLSLLTTLPHPLLEPTGAPYPIWCEYYVQNKKAVTPNERWGGRAGKKTVGAGRAFPT